MFPINFPCGNGIVMRSRLQMNTVGRWHRRHSGRAVTDRMFVFGFQLHSNLLYIYIYIQVVFNARLTETHWSVGQAFSSQVGKNTLYLTICGWILTSDLRHTCRTVNIASVAGWLCVCVSLWAMWRHSESNLPADVSKLEGIHAPLSPNFLWPNFLDSKPKLAVYSPNMKHAPRTLIDSQLLSLIAPRS
jgi:hypothetical protein